MSITRDPPRVARSDPAFSNTSEINDLQPVKTLVEKADFNEKLINRSFLKHKVKENPEKRFSKIKSSEINRSIHLHLE